ncbi:hypothetical protein TanjilG_16590 [Lupinus angustifolius]|uniref:Uncharacterized protein n=1 Tax=Lupinus angustifolius TaxID=3871 RepID=A0A1J7FZZ3_LUPAN|nr:hypothetical protein TanjilG_16590 [Lupinus angustifolius]
MRSLTNIAKHPTISLIKSSTTLKELKQIHTQLLVNGTFNNPHFHAQFIATIALHNPINLHYSNYLLHHHHHHNPNLFTLNSMIRAYSKSTTPHKSFYFYNNILNSPNNLSPDNYTFNFLVRTCAQLMVHMTGFSVHAALIKHGFEHDPHVQSGLIFMYAEMGCLSSCHVVFEGVQNPDLVCQTAMLHACAKCGDVDFARKMFDEMPHRDFVVWNAMVAGYAQCGRSREALDLFQLMQMEGVKINEVSMVSVLSACTQLGALDQGRWAHAYLEKYDIRMTVTLGTALVDMYAKCGNIGKAMKVFWGMKEKNVYTWSSAIGGLAMNGLGRESVELFSLMKKDGVHPNEVTFISLLRGCSVVGMVEEGRNHFDSMRKLYGIEPQFEHYGLMVDLYGRAGRVEEALSFIKRMPMKAHVGAWVALLHACRMYKKKEIGEYALKKIVEVEAKNDGAYVLLSNIYADYKNWEGVKNVRETMKSKGVKKVPGCSMIEVDGIMNFFMRSTTHVYSEPSSSSSSSSSVPPIHSPPGTTSGSSLETLMSEEPYAPHSSTEHFLEQIDTVGGDNGSITAAHNSINDTPILANHFDVSEEEGCITIPYKELPENWNHVPDIQSLRPLDRSFLFPGEQVHILACLSACRQDTEIITPFKVAAVMNKIGIGHSPQKENGNVENRNNSVSEEWQLSISNQEPKENNLAKTKTDRPANVSDGESLLRMEVQKRQTASLLQKFENSHFFVRISESDEPLWSKRGSSEKLSNSSETNGEKASIIGLKETEASLSSISAVIDRGNFDATVSGGAARNSIKSCALPNGDILLFSFSHFRSYSMSSLPQTTNVPTGPVKAASSKPSFEIDDWDQISSQKFLRKKAGNELLSFRGVSLERERFSVCCGLEGIYTPGRRWRRKLEIIQPVEIHSFAADCNSEDLLCVQIKNVAPAHAPDIVIFIDAITIVFDEATKSGTPSSLPIACIEAGNDHSLPNLALRKGEEHSFILKPVTSVYKDLKVQEERNSQMSKLQLGNSDSKLNLSPKSPDKREIALGGDDQYAIMVSCRCNYTASRLFFKKPISWRPRTSRDILITVASEMSRESPRPYERNSQLPVQVLTLRASNLTSEDLTLTVLAPASFMSPPSVVSLNSPTTPMSPFIGFTDFLGRINGERRIGATQRQSFTSRVKENEKQGDDGSPQSVSMTNDVIPSSGLSCTHLWLQSRVPLGCIPSQSTATIKLELLPLTNGIITLDSLQIHVKEKGVTYIPERSLKINATSSISKGVI